MQRPLARLTRGSLVRARLTPRPRWMQPIDRGTAIKAIPLSFIQASLGSNRSGNS